jgi:hypothetical protein
VTPDRGRDGAIYEGLTAINKALNDFVDNEGQTVLPAENTTEPGDYGQGDYIVETVEGIIREVKDGKNYVKVKTPKYRKWGVPIYPEVLAKLNRKPEDVPTEYTAMPNFWCKILMDNGKPKKVVWIGTGKDSINGS